MIGLNYTESGGFEMEKSLYDELCHSALKDEGIQAFEKYIGRIKWLHPTGNMFNIKSERKYAVIDVERQRTVYEADKMEDIAKKFCTATSYIGRCYKAKKLLHKQYMIVRCENE